MSKLAHGLLTTTTAFLGQRYYINYVTLFSSCKKDKYVCSAPIHAAWPYLKMWVTGPMKNIILIFDSTGDKNICRGWNI